LFLIGVDERENTAMWLFAWIFVALHFYTFGVSNMAVACMQADLGPFPKQTSKPKAAQPTPPPCCI
jgi:hypothetical protein